MIFVSDPKIGENIANIKTAIFQNKFTLRHISPGIYIQKTQFTSHKQYLFGLLCCSLSLKRKNS